MPNLILNNICYTELDSITTTWCATAQVCALPTHQCKTTKSCLSAPQRARIQRQQQRTGVRLLLQSLLKKLNIIDSLDESNFPYRLSRSQYYVCFSHTSSNDKEFNHIQNDAEAIATPYIKVAVIISRDRATGIDIEINKISSKIATRFYHPNELTILQKLAEVERDTIIRWLWQIKESFIKIHQYTLAEGLGMDYSTIIADLIKSFAENLPVLTMIHDNNSYRITAIPAQQTVIIY